MIAAFTVCTNSYLPQAAVLAESVARHAPDWTFYVGLVDTPDPDQVRSLPDNLRLLPAKDLGLPNLEPLALRYNVIELCTALKPAFCRTLFEHHPEVEQLHYLDPDTCLYSNPTVLEQGLREAAVLLTPHHLTPIPLDGKMPGENLALNHGIYNLGYLGLCRGDTASQLLRWWEERMQEHCRIDLLQGFFVDQLWFNYVPLYFEGTHILRHPGVNVAFWNLHERTLLPGNPPVIRTANAEVPLIMFHFSGFSPAKPDQITRVATRNGVHDQRALGPLLETYSRQVLANGYAERRGIESTYCKMRREDQATRQKAYRRSHPFRTIFRKLKSLIPPAIRDVLRG